VTKVRLGNSILFTGTTTAIVDTGATCMGFTTSIFNQFSNTFNGNQQPSIFITLGGVEYEVTFADYVLGNQICVGETPFFQLGDPFFRANVAVFDLSNAIPRVGIAPRNRGYTPSAQSNSLLVQRISVGSASINTSVIEGWNLYNGRNTIPVQDNMNETRYYVTLSIGTPGQPLQVLLDSGSSATAVYSTTSNSLSAGAIAGIVIGVILLVAAGVVVAIVAYVVIKKRRNAQQI